MADGVESGWLIENATSETCAPQYLVGGDGNTVWSWSADHMRALRFAREVDAYGAARVIFGIGHSHRICLHKWG